MKDPSSFSISLYNTQFGCFTDILHNVTDILTRFMEESVRFAYTSQAQLFDSNATCGLQHMKPGLI